MILENGGRPIKSIIFRVQLILEDLTWYQIEAKTHTFLSMVRYVSYLICIFINININLKNDVNILKKAP